MNKIISLVLLALVLAAGCSVTRDPATSAPPMDPKRKVAEEDCTKPFDTEGGNLLCVRISEEERRAMIAEEERQARARKEAAERAERERLERERAEQLAREEAARKAKEAEEARLAAEKRRLEEEAARKAAEERARQEALAAAAAAAALARQRAEQEAREAAARECRRVEQERSEGRALLKVFVDDYGQDEEFKEIAPQIAAFLAKPRKVKPCPPA